MLPVLVPVDVSSSGPGAEPGWRFQHRLLPSVCSTFGFAFFFSSLAPLLAVIFLRPWPYFTVVTITAATVATATAATAITTTAK